jgi:hypothetical protein
MAYAVTHARSISRKRWKQILNIRLFPEVGVPSNYREEKGIPYSLILNEGPYSVIIANADKCLRWFSLRSFVPQDTQIRYFLSGYTDPIVDGG